VGKWAKDLPLLTAVPRGPDLGGSVVCGCSGRVRHGPPQIFGPG